jgi:hypothetical protein
VLNEPTLLHPGLFSTSYSGTAQRHLPVLTWAFPLLPQAEEAEQLLKQLKHEVVRRRNFAIISHPDAGKTTLVSSMATFKARHMVDDS